MDKLISQQAAIDALNTQAEEMSHWSERYQEQRRGVLTAVNIVADCLSVQPNHCAEVGKKVLIDRQEALEAIGTLQTYKLFAGDDMILIDKAEVQTELMGLPSAQPEIIRCKDCKFYTAYDYTGKLMCKRIGKGMILPKPEDYCSYAERITDDRPD